MKEKTNQVHVNGFVNEIISNKAGDSFIVKVATQERYDDKTVNTYHSVQVKAASKKEAKAILDIKRVIDNNILHRDEEGFKPEAHRIDATGSLVVKINEGQDGVKYYNPTIVAESVAFDVKPAEGQAHNSAEFKGNISKIDLRKDFATVTIGTHYYVPSKEPVVNAKGEEKNYAEKTSFMPVEISKKRHADLFGKLESGELGVGSFVKARGQMHNDNYQDKNGVNRYGVRVDVSKFEVLVAKQAQTKAADKKASKKAEAGKKATTVKSRRSGQKL